MTLTRKEIRQQLKNLKALRWQTKQEQVAMLADRERANAAFEKALTEYDKLTAQFVAKQAELEALLRTC